MKSRILILLMTFAILFTIITPRAAPRAEAAGGTVTKTYTATADTMQLNGQLEYNGIYDNDGDGYLYVGMSNNDGFVNVRNRMAVIFDLGAPEGTIVSAELVVTVATVLRVPNHNLYMEVRGSAANSLNHNFNGTFPSVDTSSPYSDKFTAKSTAEVPMGTYLQDQTITLNVKSAVDAFTDGSDRKVTFTLNGNEADADSGRFLLYSLEASNAAFRPKLVVTYETGPVNTAPTGSFTITEGAMTSASTVNLSVTGSDPDAGDSVTHMRFANSAANLSSASWLPFSNTATFSLSGGDGAKTIYMQLRDSNNGISANSSQTILLDQTAPTGTLGINDGAAWTNSHTVTLKGTYTDGSGSGVEQVRLSNINGSWQTSWFSVADLNGRSWVLPAGEGAKTVYVQYRDKVGNSSSSTISNTITVDTIAPLITNVVNNKAYNSKVTPLFLEGSGLLNGSPYTSGTDITQDGTYILVVTDLAGNSTTVVFMIDMTAPIVAGIANGGIYNTSRMITFNEGTATLNGAAFLSGTQVSQDDVYTLVVTDAAGNVTTVNFTIDKTPPIVTGVAEGGVYKSATPVFTEGTAKLNAAAFTSGTEIVAEGAYTLVVTDAAGNETTINFAIDTTPPTVTGVAEGGVYKSATPEFTEGTAKLNAAAFTSGTEIVAEGAYRLVVMDAAGNETTINFAIDTTPPTVTGVSEGGVYRSATPVFTEGTAKLNAVPFTSGTEIVAEGTYTLVVTDATGNETTINFKIEKNNSGSPGSSGGGSETTESTSTSEVLLILGDKSQKATKVVVTTTDGKKVTTVILEEEQLKGLLKEAGNSPVIIIAVRNKSDIVNWELNAALLQSFENSNAIIQVVTENAVYSLPLDQVPADRWRNQLGANIPLKDMKIKLELSNLSDSAFVFKDSGNGQVTLVAPPLSFSVKFVYGSKEVELNQFDTYIERRIAIPEGVNLNRIMTGVKITSDGTLIHIPTRIIQEGGRYYAVLNSMSNSIYGLIQNDKSFNDVSTHWAKSSINDLASRLVINGADEERFLPDSEITRAEFMAIMIRALGLSSANKTFHFKDITEQAWYHQAVQIGYSYGLVDGYSDASFKPNEKITRQEAMVILSRAMMLVKLNKKIDHTKQQELVNHFADSEQLASWAHQAAALTIESGIIGGYKGELHPLQNITRAETAAIIQRFLQKAEFI
ncbi:S-layer homology domain-containing protein [Paenibacillus pinisoli]|nr:S-layer homology domain-containing protein [Paenibacillus pinisoli]